MDVNIFLNWRWYNQLSSDNSSVNFTIKEVSKSTLNPFCWRFSKSTWPLCSSLGRTFLAYSGMFCPPLLFSFLSTATSTFSCRCGQRTQCRGGSAVSAALREGATAGWGGGKRYTAAAAGLADGELVMGTHPLLSPFPEVGPALPPPFISLPQLPSISSQSPNIIFIPLTSKTCHLMLVTGFCRFSCPCKQGHKIK